MSLKARGEIERFADLDTETSGFRSPVEAHHHLTVPRRPTRTAEVNLALAGVGTYRFICSQARLAHRRPYRRCCAC
jgi:hypothetical protein